LRKKTTRSEKERNGKLIGLTGLIIVLGIMTFFIYSVSPKSDKISDITINEPVSVIIKPDELVGINPNNNSILQHDKEMLEIVKPYFEMNGDTVGYINVPNSLVDYPIVYSGDNEFYLTHNFNRDESKEGAIFLDFRCELEDFTETRNIILYGHRMKDGSMFKSLTNYQKKDFYYENPIISFDTIYEEHKWEVFTVFETYTNFYYIDTDFPTDEKWIKFLEKCHSLSTYKTDISFYPTDIIVTLSTCTIKKDKRLVVMARLIN